jgi:flavin reductase (DIM6/NTAB) family NADH-FMN oxidoreductase RutF
VNKLNNIKPTEFNTDIFSLWSKDWLLLTAGDFSTNDFNCMTIAWGSIGMMWNKPFIQVVVRPQRYTIQFMEKYDDFTVCAFPKKFKDDLSLLGTKSGRDLNKLAETSLNPIASEMVKTPSYKESELILECRKMFKSEMVSNNFLDPKIKEKYPSNDYHRIYFGEILNILGTEKFRRSN